MTDRPILHHLPQRQPDVDRALYHKMLRCIRVRGLVLAHSRSAEFVLRVLAAGEMLRERKIRWRRAAAKSVIHTDCITYQRSCLKGADKATIAAAAPLAAFLKNSAHCHERPCGRILGR